jgi:hypothetical protein
MLKRTCILLLLTCSQAFALPSFQQIEESAQLSNLAYDSGDIKAPLESIGHTLMHQALLPGVEVSYFLTTNKGVQFITVRGTANLQNAMVDLDVNLKQDDDLGIIAHQGFANAAVGIIKDVSPFLDKSKPVRTTGHSLGGAAAVMLAMYLDKQGYELGQLITFGQPKVTNVDGADLFEHLPLLRVVTAKDIVPLVPPLSPLQIKNLDIYWHMGEEMILLEGQDYAMTKGLKSMLRATKFASALPSEENLQAHKMQTYLALIKSKLDQANEVPYKTELNLFGVSFD